MNFLIYGAGTIGITYAYLLSQVHDVDLLVRPERLNEISAGVAVNVKDLRKKETCYKRTVFYPNCVTEIHRPYDGILVAVDRCQLKQVLPKLAQKQELTKYFAFMQNNWDIRAEIGPFLTNDKYIIAFPSSVGGGRDEKELDVIIFDEATRLGGECEFGIRDLREGLRKTGIKTRYDKHIFDWLKVHYLQQSITAGAVLESGSFQAFSSDYEAVKKMVKAFREGIEVCRSQGVQTYRTFPAPLFCLPASAVARTMQKMFLEANTAEMVNNHMKKGLMEWIAGYKEVLTDGLEAGLPMTVWKSYEPTIEGYLKTI